MENDFPFDKESTRKMLPAHHTSIQRETYSNQWITPEFVLDIVRSFYGHITYDLASSDEANKTVHADLYWTINDPCPPNPPIRDSVIWCKLIEAGSSGGFLFFNQDHWRQVSAPLISTTAIVLRKRLAFHAPEDAYRTACARADLRGQKAPARKTSSPFPSTLILSGDPISLRPGVLKMLSAFGHVMRWKPVGRPISFVSPPESI